MTKREKRLRKLLQNPKGASFQDIHALLNDFGYVLSRIKGSHHIYEHSTDQNFVIPVHNKRIKKSYIKDLKNLLKKYI